MGTIKITHNQIVDFNFQDFLWENVRKDKIILSEYFSGISIAIGFVQVPELLHGEFVNFEDNNSCIQLIKRAQSRNFIEASYILCLIKKYYPHSFDPKVCHNGILFSEGVDRGIVSFFKDVDKPIWHLKKYFLNDISQSFEKVKIFEVPKV